MARRSSGTARTRAKNIAAVVQALCGLVVVLMLLNSLTGGSDLRTGFVPISAGLLAFACGLAIWLAGRRRLGVPQRLASASSILTALALMAVACFFFALALLSAMDSDLLDADTPLSSIGTVLASVLTFVVVPVGAVLFGYCLLRDRRQPLQLRIAPLLLIVLLIGGGVLLAMVPEDQETWAQFVWFAALAALVAYLATLSAAHGSEPDAYAQREVL